MMRFTLLLLAVLLGGADRLAAQDLAAQDLAAQDLAAQDKVEVRGISSAIKLEEVIYGHLTGINGKFKMRATELTFAPDAFLGAHHHVGPGVRYVLSGELTFTQAGQATIYKTGDYFFETGNVVHTAQNKTKEPLRVLFVEILPNDWAAPTVILPKP